MQKIIWGVTATLLLSTAVIVVLCWRRPLAVVAWINRRALVHAGFSRIEVPTTVGKQTLFFAGTGASMILLHGAGDQAGAWAKVAPELKGKYRVIVPDLAGHGDSEPKLGPLHVATVLLGLEQIANAEPGKLIIVGNSLGGWVAALYARKYPDKIARLVLVNGGPLTGLRPDITLTPRTRAEARRTTTALFDPGSFDLPDYVLDDIVRESQTGPLMRLSETANEMPRYLLDGRLNEITVPVNLVWGESDQVMSLVYAKGMLSQLPNAQLTVLSRCGHAPEMECPKAFTRRLMEVLESPVIPHKEYRGAEGQ
jgi:pimeloyl-ACP methyl ester carboxylesterase